MITIIFKVNYSRAEYATLAVSTYRRDVSSIKAIIDNALNLRAKLIFDSTAFQQVNLSTNVKSVYAKEKDVIIEIETNQRKLVSGYENALNGQTLVVFDGVCVILKKAFERDEFLLGDYIVSIYASVSGQEETVTPIGQIIEPVVSPVANFFEKIKIPLIITIVAIAVIVIFLLVIKIIELQKK